EDGSEGLLVTYLDSEQKPENTYLWLLNEDGFPNSFKMWTKKNPIGGLKASWDEWKVTKTNIFLPSNHKLWLQTIKLTNLEAYNKKNHSYKCDFTLKRWFYVMVFYKTIPWFPIFG